MTRRVNDGEPGREALEGSDADLRHEAPEYSVADLRHEAHSDTHDSNADLQREAPEDSDTDPQREAPDLDARFPSLDPWVAALKHEPALELDWDSVELRLLTELRTPEKTAPRSRWLRPAVALSLAAVLLLALGYALRPSPIVSPPTELVQRQPLQGESLALGQLLEAGEEPLHVTHPGLADWTLERIHFAHENAERAGAAPAERSGADRAARARLVTAHPRVTLSLEQGSVSAVVVPGSAEERFVVVVGGTRVVARGTELRVTRGEGEVEVEVTRGVIAVGPAEPPNREAEWVLHAPASGVFSLDGARSGTRLEGRVIAPTPPRPAPKPPPRAPTPKGVSAEQALTRVAQLTQACFAEHTPALGGVRVTAEATLHIAAGPDGRLTWRATPPLAPAVTACVQGKLPQLTISGAARQASRRVSLGQLTPE
ncbi:MAG: FecR domain-containing protein [Polyangiaceae bacterium]|nr:FecR domain-containing protein [Polyangiaceae bacterium]MCW5792421.1 FecR domain-containing protein [Polyangiaceae bacterium]